MTREEAIEQLRLGPGINEDVSEEYNDAVNMAIEALEQEQKWIPVSERLPEENGDYFVTLENGVVEILGYSTTQRTTYPKGFYYISNGFSWRQTINPVIAWMPLPEPYKAESKTEQALAYADQDTLMSAT